MEQATRKTAAIAIRIFFIPPSFALWRRPFEPRHLPISDTNRHNDTRTPPYRAFPMSDPADLKSAGLKATLPRLKILGLFESASDRHLTAEEVYRLLIAEGE